MKCHFYLQRSGGPAIRLGPIDAKDDADARRLAAAEFERRPEIGSIDIWCDHGELYRVERPAGSASGPIGSAWKRAFEGARADRVTP